VAKYEEENSKICVELWDLLASKIKHQRPAGDL
jgi:hypothetical protein